MCHVSNELQRTEGILLRMGPIENIIHLDKPFIPTPLIKSIFIVSFSFVKINHNGCFCEMFWEIDATKGG